MEPDLHGKVVLITGGARGIGARIAQRFAEQGSVVHLADIDGGAARAQARAMGPPASGVAMDVRDLTHVTKVAGRIAQEHGQIDVLVNNAGLVAVGAFDRTSAEQWNQLVAVNLTGIFNCVQAVAPIMVERARGTILNMASVSAMKGGGAFGNVWYGATKAAVVALTAGLARELGPRGSRVNAIAPSIIDTDMVHALLTPQVREQLLARFPLGRLAVTDDTARLAVFLASASSSFITGETIAVDDGFLKA